MNKRNIILAIVAITVIVGGGIGAYWFTQGDTTALSATTTSSDSTIDTSDTTSDIDWSALPTTEVTLGSDTLTITDTGTYILSGSSTAGVVVNSDGNVRLTLEGVTLSSTSGPAIYVQNAKNTVINLADGTTSTVSDTTTHNDQELTAAIYSHDDLIFTGNGTVNITGNFADGISSNDDLTISSGTINVTATDDGIRGKDSVEVYGGTITVNAGDEGIKATNDTDADKGYLYIKDGSITVTAGDHALKAEQRVVIDGGTITVKKSTEGIAGTNITINGGTINIYATDDGINAASSTSSDIYVKVTGGEVTVEVAGGDTDCIDSNGSISVTGGTIKATNPSIGSGPATAFDYNSSAEFTGGTIYINGTQVSEIPAESMGGGGMRR